MNSFNTTATFYRETLVVSDMGEQKKVRSILYADIPAKIRATKNQSGSARNLLGEENFFSDGWQVIVDASFSGANVNDTVSVNGEIYKILKKWEQSGEKARNYFYFCEK